MEKTYSNGDAKVADLNLWSEFLTQKNSKNNYRNIEQKVF